MAIFNNMNGYDRMFNKYIHNNFILLFFAFDFSSGIYIEIEIKGFNSTKSEND